MMGKVLTLARGTPGAKLKRWKTLTSNKTLSGQQEAKIKTDLMMGRIKSVEDGQTKTFRSLATQYLQLVVIKDNFLMLGIRPLLRMGFCLSSEPKCWVGLPFLILGHIEITAD